MRDLAVQFERKAERLDDATEQRSVLPGVRWTQFELDDEEVSALQKSLTDAVEYDRYPLALRIQAWRRILAKFGSPAMPSPLPRALEADATMVKLGRASAALVLCTTLNAATGRPA
jgi:hypothetical protein